MDIQTLESIIEIAKNKGKYEDENLIFDFNKRKVIIKGSRKEIDFFDIVKSLELYELDMDTDIEEDEDKSLSMFSSIFLSKEILKKSITLMLVPFVIDALERINLDLGLVAKMFVIVYVVELSDSVKDSFKLSRKESIQYIRDAILTIFFELVNYLRRDPLAFKNKEKLKKRLSRVISRRS